MTSSDGGIFRLTGHLCGELTGHRWIPPQRPVTRSFDVFFDLRQNKRLSKQSWGWWFETLSRPLWRHCNESWPQSDDNLTTEISSLLGWIYFKKYENIFVFFYNSLTLWWCRKLKYFLMEPLLQTWFNFNPSMDKNHLPGKVWDEITYPFLSFDGATVEVLEWISNFTPHFMMDVINNPCWDSS